MAPNTEFDIVMIGHFAKDRLVVDGQTETASGGAVYYGGICGSHMGLKVTIITRLKKEDYQFLEIFQRGVSRNPVYYNLVGHTTDKARRFAGLFFSLFFKL